MSLIIAWNILSRGILSWNSFHHMAAYISTCDPHFISYRPWPRFLPVTYISVCWVAWDFRSAGQCWWCYQCHCYCCCRTAQHPVPSSWDVGRDEETCMAEHFLYTTDTYLQNKHKRLQILL